MKLMIAIVQDEDVTKVIKTLMKEEYRVTKLASTGGFLKSGNTTLLIGIEDEKVDEVVTTIEELCKARRAKKENDEIEVSGATIFVVDIDEFKRI